MSAELQEFINKARKKQLGDDAIKDKLLAAGWQESAVAAALSSSGSDELAVPLPPDLTAPHPDGHTGARPSITALQAALQHVLLWVFTLTTSVMVGVVSAVLFGKGSSGSSEALLTYVVLEAVTFAPFAFLYWRYVRELKRQPSLMTGRVWSIITIVLHSIGLIGAVVGFILVLILVHDGETMPGVVATSVIGVMNALVVSAYALANFVKSPGGSLRLWYLRLFPLLLFTLVAVLGVFALVRVGPLRADDQTKQNLVTTITKIHEYAVDNTKLPEGLGVVPGVPAGVTYERLSTSGYRLCGEFKVSHKGMYASSYQNSEQDDSYPSRYLFDGTGSGNQCWKFYNSDLRYNTSTKLNPYYSCDPSPASGACIQTQ